LRKHWYQEKLVHFLRQGRRNLELLINLQYPMANPFDFESKVEYEQFLRDNEFITLNGDKVRSYQEVLIGNWLFRNGIAHEYEANYERNVRVELGHNYKPDFHIKDTDIYIEHYGIDRNGNTRPGIDKTEYNRQIIEKRNIHQTYGTRLIETYHYEWVEGTLFENLQARLAEFGITPEPLSDEEVFAKLEQIGTITKLASIMAQAVAAVRISNLDIEEARRRFNDAGFAQTDDFIRVLGFLKSEYEKELDGKGEIDFDDMIIQSIECIQAGDFKPAWKYILVDEFQDISQSRMNLLTALLDAVPGSSLFAVGDDWQSIYRFSGGKLELTTRFSEIIGSHSLTKLQKTFRYNNSIAEIAGRFVMQNPEQYRKQVTTHEMVDTPQVFIVASNPNGMTGHETGEDKIRQIVQKIEAHEPGADIAVLARYRQILKRAEQSLKAYGGRRRISFWTFHKSKGLEADHCILLGFEQGKYGFPNENRDHQAIEALLPSLDSFPHSEERRLMYVALTRARKKAYIVADPLAPSAFIMELITGDYGVSVDSDKFNEAYREIYKCRYCEEGYLLPRFGYGKRYYVCSMAPGCEVISRSCHKCGSPMYDDNSSRVCQNPDCDAVTQLCPRCFRPLVHREGKYGPFLGCSGYGAPGNSKCTFTRRLRYPHLDERTQRDQ